MFIQGNLQNIFDALYSLGIIDPVLKSNWKKVDQQARINPRRFQEAVNHLNQVARNNEDIVSSLQKMDEDLLFFIAMEVARELVDFEDRKTIH